MSTRRFAVMRRLLQTILAAVAVVALVTGGWGFLGSVSQGGYDVQLDPRNMGNLMLDNNMRYFSGLWIGIGLTLIVVLGSIERQVTLLRVIAVAVFLGGVGRVVSMVDLGVPSALFCVFALAELAFPLLLLLQREVGCHEGRIRDDATRQAASQSAQD